MSQARYVAHWHGECGCGHPITFSPDRTLVTPEHEYKCYKCGREYWINRKNGTYYRVGTDKNE